MIVSAHEIARTRFCAAADCPDEPLTGSTLCGRCDRRARLGVAVPLHKLPAPLPQTRRCSLCGKRTPIAKLINRRCRACLNARAREGRS